MNRIPINATMAGVCRLSLTSQQLVIEVVGEAEDIVRVLNYPNRGRFQAFEVLDGEPVYLNTDHIWRVIPGPMPAILR
jgi:hypothetical protein